ncbi:hypothetical protein HK103_006622 [Boothiomyces macroporosus]|uniref:Uncharacterized protein n=1 Tax=Boothiomyces macroporosus TaxID=261099 RepID=A0AAD5UDG9_9FUNG|nr:hypothetical protein HK103_006622 [Boothiomyces macroporosus]
MTAEFDTWTTSTNSASKTQPTRSFLAPTLTTDHCTSSTSSIFNAESTNSLVSPTSTQFENILSLLNPTKTSSFLSSTLSSQFDSNPKSESSISQTESTAIPSSTTKQFDTAQSSITITHTTESVITYSTTSFKTPFGLITPFPSESATEVSLNTLISTTTTKYNASSSYVPLTADTSNNSVSIVLVIFGIAIPIVAIIVAAMLIYYKCRRRSRSITPELHTSRYYQKLTDESFKIPTLALNKFHEDASNDTITNLEKEETAPSITPLQPCKGTARPSSSPFANLRHLERVGGFVRLKMDSLAPEEKKSYPAKEEPQLINIKGFHSKRQTTLPTMHTLCETPQRKKPHSAEAAVGEIGQQLPYPHMIPLRESKAFVSKKTGSSVRMDNDLIIDNLEDDSTLPPVFQITKKIEKKRLAPLDVQK